MTIPLSVLPAPTRFPYACVGCMGQKGPVVAFHRELPGYGDVFLCNRCTREAAITAGIVKREKAEEREEIVAVKSHAEQEVTWRDEALAAERAKVETLERKLAEVEDLLGQEHGRIIQLEGRMAEQAKQALELVGEVS